MLENVIFLEENTGRMISDINHSKIFFDPPPRVFKIKKKNKQSLIKLKSFCTAKEIIKRKKERKKPLKMGENICKWSDWQEINLQNIWTAYADQYKKKLQMGGRSR